MIFGLVACLRPKQWAKNLLLFAGYLFTIQRGHPLSTLLVAVAAFGVFCAAASAGYIVNDLIDADRDRRHPTKSKRPIAGGRVSKGAAAAAAFLLIAGSLVAAFSLDVIFGAFTGAYLLLTLSYSAFLKHIPILDLLIIAAGFVIRAAAGAAVIHVEISPWLLACTTLLALFLGLAKRRSELVLLDNGSVGHRATLGYYTVEMLDQMLSISASASLMTYILYTFTPGSKTGTEHPLMMLTAPFVVYGLFRYLFLVHTKNAGGSPEQVLFEDKPMQLNLLLYIVASIAALKL